ncbi:MAG: C39 family peptidase [Acutalibacteraceae bacterium]|nr:C39 family peptidase [Acutalibacteraceae bacterium]
MSNKLEISELHTEEDSKVFNNSTEINSSEATADTTDYTNTESKSATQLSKINAILNNALKNIYIKALLVTLSLAGAVGATAFFATYFEFNNNDVSAVEVTATALSTQPITEPATQRVVPATDEKLSFKKERYKVKVGKTVKTSYTYTPPAKNKSDKPEITYTSNNIDIATVDKNGKIKGIATGTTSIVALAETGIYTTVPVTVTVPKSHTIEDVPMLYQGNDYPSGCESVSSTMLLNYYGFDITTNEFIDNYLPMSDITYNDNGEMTAPDAYSAFIGSPYSELALGCFPPVIKNAMNDYFEDKNYKAVDVTGESMKTLTSKYIANNQPVLIWATMWMYNPAVTYEWKVKNAKEDSPYKDGDTYQWLANEHCMVLVGYDEDYYYLNDPLRYSTTAYSRSVFEDRYKQMGKCALVIEKIEE